MAGYIKITRSKNLRNKLISLMYLIFLVLSAIQIPIEWIKVAPHIQTYISKPRTEFKEQDSVLAQFNTYVTLLDEEFKVALGYNEVTGQIPEMNSYSITDNYFIVDKKGELLFKELQKLNEWAYTLNESDPRKKLYLSLFSADLENGLLKNNDNKWIAYRWKHLPAGLARCFIEELKLRVKLMNSGDFESVEDIKEPEFTLMTKYASMHIGDEADFAAKGDSIKEILITRNNVPVNDYEEQGNGFKFRPEFAGEHRISVKGKSKSESMVIEVLPSSFPRKDALPFRICYKGVTYQQSIPFKQSNLSLTIDGDDNAQINSESGMIQFTPKALGWSSIRIKSGSGLLFHDSVFVKALPDPYIKIKGVAGFTLGRKRLSQMKSLELIASHPSFKEESVYEVTSFKIRKVANTPLIEAINGSSFSLESTQLNYLKYLIVYDIIVRKGNESQKIDQPIIIQIM